MSKSDLCMVFVTLAVIAVAATFWVELAAPKGTGIIQAIVLTGWDDYAYDPEVVHNPWDTPANAWHEYYPYFPEYGWNPPASLYGTVLKRADIHYTLDQLQENFPCLEWVAVFTFWWTPDTTSEGNIKPRWEWEGTGTGPDYGFNKPWIVAGLDRGSAPPTTGSHGGTPNDDGFVWVCKELQRRGYKVAIYPFVRVDSTDTWRGNIEPKDIDSWFNAPWGYKHFQLHYANLLQKNGFIPDAFIIGGEMISLTNSQPENGYPAVQKLKELAAEIKKVLPKTLVGYAADWGEWHHNSVTDGDGIFKQYQPELTNYVYHLDPLWSDPNIDFIGIDAYFPLTEIGDDYRNIEVIKQGWFSGRYYDWDPQLGSDIKIDPKVAIKNLRWWWENEHWNYNGVKTAWVPKSKNIWFTEIGYPSVHAATNEPNVFPPGLPKGSDGSVDFDVQRLAFQALSDTMGQKEYIGPRFVWNVDARPFPTFPQAIEIWADGPNWEKGHWIQGKIHDDTTAVGDGGIVAAQPDEYALFPCYPNPFNPITTIAYSLPKTSDVTLTIYTITGQKVAVLVDGHHEAGHHSVLFDGSGFANGVYLYLLEAGSFVETRRMVLIK